MHTRDNNPDATGRLPGRASSSEGRRRCPPALQILQSQLGVAAGTRRRFTAHHRVIAAYQGQRTRSGHGLLRQGESKCRNGHRIITSTNVFAKRFCANLAKSRKRVGRLDSLEWGAQLCVLGGLMQRGPPWIARV